MKILVLTERFFPEEFIINELASEWAAGGLQVDVLTQAPSYPYGKIYKGYSNRPFSSERWNDITVFRFFTVTGYRESLLFKLLNYLSFVFAGTLAAVIKARGYDRIFIYHTGPLTLAIPAIIARKLYGVPVTIWTQDVWPDTVYAYGFRKTRVLSAVLDRVVAFVYSNCDRIFVSCEGFRQRIAPYAPGKPIHHFPNWPVVVPQKSGADKIRLSGKFNFTFAGNIGKVQNLENILRGFALASAENDDMQLNIIGDGSHLDTLKKLVADENIKGVMFWGRKKQQEMPAYFSASDVMVISLEDKPIFSLTVPAKFQAYLAFGKPIFCAMAGEVRRLTEEYKIGFCASPSEVKEIRDGFLRFYKAREGGFASFEQNARTLLDGVYNKDKIVNSMRQLVTGT